MKSQNKACRKNNRIRSLVTGLAFVLSGYFVAGIFASAPSFAAAGQPSFFNSTETQSSNLKAFKKWTGALKKYSRERALAKKGDCSQKEMNACHYRQWINFLKMVSKKDKMTQVKLVNERMNKAKYITDIVNWGIKDYWESPGEFMAKFGDCEDYAIIKYMSLRLLGFKEDELRVVAVKDMNLKIGHAVMVLFFEGKTYVLDNQIKQVVEAKTIHHYQPIFSINRQFWWRHHV